MFRERQQLAVELVFRWYRGRVGPQGLPLQSERSNRGTLAGIIQRVMDLLLVDRLLSRRIRNRPAVRIDLHVLDALGEALLQTRIGDVFQSHRGVVHVIGTQTELPDEIRFP